MSLAQKRKASETASVRIAKIAKVEKHKNGKYKNGKHKNHNLKENTEAENKAYAELLGNRKVVPIQDTEVFHELDDISDEFLEKYKEIPLSCVSPGMIDGEAVLFALIDLPKDKKVNLPGMFKGHRVVMDYGIIEPAHRTRHDDYLKPGISIGSINSDSNNSDSNNSDSNNSDSSNSDSNDSNSNAFTLGPFFRVEKKIFMLTVEHGVKNNNIVIQPGGVDDVCIQ